MIAKSIINDFKHFIHPNFLKSLLLSLIQILPITFIGSRTL